MEFFFFFFFYGNEFFFSEQPVSIEAGNNEHKHKDNKINIKTTKKLRKL